MTNFQVTRRFDDRSVDFRTGKKVSPPMIDRKVCDCCKQRIVKGAFTTIGTLGDDCVEVARRASWLPSFEAYVASQRAIGWSVKPAVGRFLQAAVYA